MIDADNGVWYEDDEISNLRSQLHVEVFSRRRALFSKKREWYWRTVHRNGNITSDCANGYSNKSDCMHMVGYHYPDLKVIEL